MLLVRSYHSWVVGSKARSRAVAALGAVPSLPDLKALLDRDGKRSVECLARHSYVITPAQVMSFLYGAHHRLDHVSLTAFLEQLGRAARSLAQEVSQPASTARFGRSLNDIAAATASAAEAGERASHVAWLAERALTGVRKRLLW